MNQRLKRDVLVEIPVDQMNDVVEPSEHGHIGKPSLSDYDRAQVFPTEYMLLVVADTNAETIRMERCSRYESNSRTHSR